MTHRFFADAGNTDAADSAEQPSKFRKFQRNFSMRESARVRKKRLRARLQSLADRAEMRAGHKRSKVDKIVKRKRIRAEVADVHAEFAAKLAARGDLEDASKFGGLKLKPNTTNRRHFLRE